MSDDSILHSLTLNGQARVSAVWLELPLLFIAPTGPVLLHKVWPWQVCCIFVELLDLLGQRRHIRPDARLPLGEKVYATDSFLFMNFRDPVCTYPLFPVLGHEDAGNLARTFSKLQPINVAPQIVGIVSREWLQEGAMLYFAVCIDSPLRNLVDQESGLWDEFEYRPPHIDRELIKLCWVMPWEMIRTGWARFILADLKDKSNAIHLVLPSYYSFFRHVTGNLIPESLAQLHLNLKFF